ncbi:hypothetical protein IIE18_12375 [Pseudomonas sp. V1]|uniref:hypothetical protein n=1 Tax=Pseudomonas arcuscaelestis TaxID=2710591 RepID=UPI00193F5B74|nr:hypothetical protein [Pseudomonas arcuscaelestis]MBM3105934.1 hypothetical protein [Pseudomonas arcuscaelestis]
MKKEVRKELAKGYVEQFDQAVATREETLDSLANEIRSATESAAKHLMSLEIHLSRFPVSHRGKIYSTFWKWRSAKKSAGTLRLYLKCNEVVDGRLQSGRRAIDPDDRADVKKALSGSIGREAANELLRDLGSLLMFSERVSRWAKVLGVGFKIDVERHGSVISAWVGAIEEFSGPAMEKLNYMVERFNALDPELQHALIEFNEARQPVRYRSIICRQDLDPSDPLGPSEPIFRVVHFFNRTTGARKTVPINKFKSILLSEEMKASLAKSLGRDPEPDEIAAALQRQKRRSPTKWITSELISHCYLGKHSGRILRQQKTIAAVMDEWGALRAQFQALL